MGNPETDLEFDDQLVDPPQPDATAPDSFEPGEFPDPDFSEPVEPEAFHDAPASPGVAHPAESPPAQGVPPAYVPPHDGGFTPSPFSPAPAQPVAPAPATPQVQFYTADQLQQAYEAGVITKADMEVQWQNQTRELAKQDALEAVRQDTQNKTIKSQLQQFQQFAPGWDQAGSAANQRVSPAYQELLGRGYPQNDNTVLLALERAFGPIQQLQNARATQTRTAAMRDTSQEVGRRANAPSRRTKVDPLSVLTKEEVQLYREDIRNQTYKNWDAVRAKLVRAAKSKYNPKLRDAHAGAI